MKSEAQRIKEAVRKEQIEQKQIRRRNEYLSNSGKYVTIDGVKWNFLLNPKNDFIIMVSEEGKLAKYDNYLANKTISLYSTQISNRGYEIHASKKASSYLVHRLVGLAFIRNTKELETIDHIDGDKTNNHVSNLQWMSRKANGRKAIYEEGKTIGKKLRPVRITKDTVSRVFNSCNDAAKFIGCNVGTVANCMNPKQDTKSAYGWTVEKL